MVLKLVKTKDYEIEKELLNSNIIDKKELEEAIKEIDDYVSTITTEEISYKGNIKDVNCSYPLNSKNSLQTMTIYYNNGNEEHIVIGEYNKEKDIYEPTYRYIYLMNDEGKTIERLV